MSDAIVLTRNGEQMELASKRNRIEYEQANAALETPTIYQDAMDVVWCNQDRIEGTQWKEDMDSCEEISK